MKKIKRTIKLRRTFRRRPAADERVREAFANVPNITNETVAEHREDVLGSARKFIYPLKHSRRRAVTISGSIFAAALIVFVVYVSVSLYRLQSTSGFMYGVTKVVPFPVAKAGDSWVSYNSYLFQLRRYIHYYTTQQEANFDGEDKPQLANYKKQALQRVINDAYVKQLAKSNGVRVARTDIDRQVQLVRSQNRLGSSDREFREVLDQFWGWDEADFRRSLGQELLAQAVVTKLDVTTTSAANGALSQIRAGTDFATVATQVSQDESTKASGGQYAAAIDPTNTDIPAAVVVALNQLQPGQVSEVINTGYSLEIVRLVSRQDGNLTASHIVFNLRPISDFIQPLRRESPPRDFIGV